VVVALLNRRDRDHEACRAAWSSTRAKVISVEGVLVEAAHLLRRDPRGLRALVELFLSAQVEFEAPTPELLSRAVELMERYRNVPMDFVDALLVATAERQRIDEIFTLDRRGFETYRWGRFGRFRLLPQIA
jgi:predicted nucleic acid-binding protein